MTFISYAQNFEDVLLWRALGAVGNGFYIDVGAHHPDTDSVTRAFYERGWHGINIEPVPDDAARLRAARPRDVTLQLALGAARGEAPFFRVPGTGLSTLDAAAAAAHEARGFPVERDTVEVRTLADICRRHAAADVHFLKIDVEGAEEAVLRGADFSLFRPWIVLVEATAPLEETQTHEGWDGILRDAGYRFVWFDGLNRFYVAAERHAQLAGSFTAPPNVFDDFLRAGDSAAVTRLAAADTELALLRGRLAAAEQAAEEARTHERRSAERDAHQIARLREAVARDRAGVNKQKLHESLHELQLTHLRLQATEARVGDLQVRLHESLHELQQTHLRLQATERALEEVRTSHSWRATAPVRAVLRRVRPAAASAAQHIADPVAIEEQAPDPTAEAVGEDATDLLAVADAAPGPGAVDEPEREPAPDDEDDEEEALPIVLPPPGLPIGVAGELREVHQFHSGSAVGDAITNAMLLTRDWLRGMGYRSEIFTEEPPLALESELRPMEELPRHGSYVLIVHHSIGYDRFEQLLALPARKVLVYHNITPPEFLARHPVLQRYAVLGRAQLPLFRGRVHAALAVSEYNAIELRRAGLEPVRTCTILFDVDALRAKAAATRPDGTGAPFTVLFVGRINESKNQLALVDAFAVFSRRFAQPARLVLVGHLGDEKDGYADALRRRMAASDVSGTVVLTGAVPDSVRDGWYAQADLYVSLSLHEGFGVPLVEAMAFGVPVLAWPCGAVPYTLGDSAILLPSLGPDAVADAMLSLAQDPDARARQADAQRRALERFERARQLPVLAQALLRAGAAPPPDDAARPVLRERLRVSVAGHVNGTYSLAAINRDLALRLDEALPGRVRLLPVEGGPTLNLSGVPADQKDAVTALVEREPHPTGPELVISQHYPVYVPERSGDVPVAFLFWEESLLPADTIRLLSRSFRAVVAPTAFVRDALLESGLSVPVRVIPPAVRLDRFAALRPERDARRAARPANAPHRFLHVSSCFPRKGVDVLLRAWAQAFRASDPVELVIKGFPNPHNEVPAMLEALRREHPDAAPVTLIDRDLGEDELLALYRDADTMVLPTRGEGYNLPAAEALAAGIPLIVTGRGGHRDFCVGEAGPHAGIRLLDCVPAPSGSHLATPHSLWLEPDEADLVAALRDAASRNPVTPAEPALPGAAALADAYATLALDVLLTRRVEPVRVSWVSSWNLRCGVAEYSRQLLDGIRTSHGDDLLQVRVLSDHRTPPEVSEAARYWPCWQIGDDRSLEPLAAALAADDADAVMIQHQPGLLPFSTLAALTRHRALAGRVTMATLHNTRYLLDLDAHAQGDALDGLSRLDKVLVHTVADLERLQALGLRDNLMLLPHGVAAPLPSRPPRVLSPQAGGSDGLAGNGPLIGCSGFFLPGKGIDVLIEAFGRLRQRWPTARLALINAVYDEAVSGPEVARCRRMVAERGLGHCVLFRTDFLPQDEVLDTLSSCDVIALPYRPSKEASSAALRTALTTGVPVAVTPIDLFAEAGNAVFRFEGLEAAAVASGLDALLSDADERGRLQREGRAWLANRHWPDVGFRLAGMIAGLVRTRALDM